jgi:hypothetical protein
MAKATLDPRESAFLQPSYIQVDGLSLRAFSIADLVLSRRLRLSMLEATTDQNKALSPEEQMRQVAAYVWSHHEDIDVVLSALETKTDEELDRLIFRYQFNIPLEAVPKVTSIITTASDRVLAAQVEILDKPSAPGASQPSEPGNS